MPNYKDMSPEEKRAYHTQALAEHKRRKEKGRAKTHHGGWGTPEYIAFRDAKSRCENPRNKRYADWGGRGIRFLFTSFEQFLAHIGTRPQGLTLDRKDNDGNYELGNVHWATRRAQAHNRRSVNWANQYVRKTDKTAEHPQNQKPQSAATPKANQPPKVIVLH